MNSIYLVPFAVAAGACISLQAAANGRLGKNLADPLYAAIASLCLSFLTMVTMVLIVRPAPPSLELVRSQPWHNWIGGPLGVLIVMAGAMLAPRLGAAAFIACVVGGQLLSSMLFDHFAILGLPEQPITLGRVFGGVLVVLGVVCIKYL
ncbi:MAG: DMT family transporter [Gemmataceae bacterium]